MIRTAHTEDAKSIARIYNHYIQHTIITFETDPVSDVEMADRIKDISSAALPWIVFQDDHSQDILGYAYASKWKGRCAYRHAVESTVYLDSEKLGKGLGKALYQHLLDELTAKNFHTVIGGIALPNTSSVALHEKMGFQKVAHFKEVGRKFDQWIDVGYWQLFL